MTRPNPTRRRACTAVLVLMATAVSACASMEAPKPWEKGELARPSMRMDADPLEARFSEHVYFSKESASGGSGVGGGGCGCN